MTIQNDKRGNRIEKNVKYIVYMKIKKYFLKSLRINDIILKFYNEWNSIF